MAYTVLQHDLLDSEAARLLPATARAMLVDFLRLWLRRTRNGRVPVSAISFTWTGCAWVVNRETFDRHRGKLVAYGFIRCVNRKLGLFAFSEKWRAYKPTEAEWKRLIKHDHDRNTLRESVIEERSAGRSSTTTAGCSAGDASTTVESSADESSTTSKPDPEALQCRKSQQHAVPEDPAPSNTAIQEDPPQPPREAEVPGAEPGNGGGGKVRHVKIDGRRVQVWPMLDCNDSASFLAWANKVHGYFSDDEQAETMRRYKELEAADEQREKRDADPVSAFLAAWADADPDDRAGVAAAALGDSSPRAVHRAAAVLAKKGTDALKNATVDLLRDGVTPDEGMKWLEYRADSYAQPTTAAPHRAETEARARRRPSSCRAKVSRR